MKKCSFEKTKGSKTPKTTFIKRGLLLLIACLCLQTGFSQSKKQKTLEAQRTRLQKEIKKVNALLFNTQQKEKNLLQQVSALRQKIKVRSQLIETLDEEKNLLTTKIDRNLLRLDTLNQELTLLKKDYGDMVFKSYKSRTLQNRMMFVLSSKDFHQAYKRLQYMRQYRDFRKKQGAEILLKKNEITALNNDLTAQKIQKENLVAEYRETRLKIEVEKREQEKLISKIKSQEKKYTAQIKRKQKEERAIDRQIEKLIRAAIAASKKKTKSRVKGFSLTPEAKILAAKFAQNRGKLPWPVTQALVVRKFGKIPHETLRGITLQSNGIHIATQKESTAKSVFEGEVLAIQISSSGLKTVMVQHGNYISLYGNLESVLVQKGAAVALKQSLGKIHTDKVTGKTILKFQIWKDTQKQNPTHWLLRL
jgi:septal ring factor EnvC (AmiA/AmiB activator)